MAYNKNLEDYFYHMVKENGKDVEKAGIEFFVSDASKAVYEEIWGDLGIKYKYTFSAKNKDVTIGDKKLFINADGTQLLWGAKEAEAKLIATIEGTTIKYNKVDDAAKEFLNLFGHNELKPNQQFAIIEVSATYGNGCELKLAPAYNFNARFLRPLDIESNDKAEFQDAEANGSSVLLGNLFKANDWRDKAVIVYNSENKKYEAAVENTVNLYTYYKINKITLDLENATCDVNKKDEQMPINETVIKLTVLDKVGGTKISHKDINVTDINKLNEIVLNYENNLGNTKDFTIMVPVKVQYSWGTVSAKVAIAVKGTIANR